jgi:hypothetical protein
MVFTTIALSRRYPGFDGAMAWALAGLVFALPVAWLFSGLLGNSGVSLFSAGCYGLLVGALSGLVAWCFQPDKQAADI